MKTKQYLLVAGLACALTPGAVNLLQAQDSNSSSSDSKSAQQEQSQHTASTRPHRVSEQELKKKVTKVNKSSSFVGMKVENLQNQNLGKVEDLVFDPDTGKISYAVLSVGGFLGMNEKYIAVPLNALTPAPGEDHLILDADKQRLERAPGFSKDKWPDLDTPAWSAAAGFPGPSNTNAVGRVGQSGSQRGSASENEQSYSGKITKVDKDAKTITVSGDSGEKNFSVDHNAQIRAENNNNAKLDDLKVGSHVHVDYSDKNGQSVAKTVEAKDKSDSQDKKE